MENRRADNGWIWLAHQEYCLYPKRLSPRQKSLSARAPTNGPVPQESNHMQRSPFWQLPAKKLMQILVLGAWKNKCGFVLCSSAASPIRPQALTSSGAVGAPAGTVEKPRSSRHAFLG